MKKVVDGRVYDTETAAMLHGWSNGHYCDDFHFCRETLYETGKGNLFIHGEGGAPSPHAEFSGRASTAGSNIRPLTVEEAK